MQVAPVCECGHYNWQHHYPEIDPGCWCAFCRCTVFIVDNLKTLERASEISPNM